MRSLIILGTARKDGETEEFARSLQQASGWELMNLSDYSFSHYDYEHLNRDDDYLPLMKRIIENYDTLVFVTPVYWYAMSGIMKVFFDRITDLLTIEKDWGRKLRGKNMAAVSCSYGNNLGDHFWLPFRESASYLGMQYLGHLHTVMGKDHADEVKVFIEQVETGNKK